jgi:hypothetical protein
MLFCTRRESLEEKDSRSPIREAARGCVYSFWKSPTFAVAGCCDFVRQATSCHYFLDVLIAVQRFRAAAAILARPSRTQSPLLTRGSCCWRRPRSGGVFLGRPQFPDKPMLPSGGMGPNEGRHFRYDFRYDSCRGRSTVKQCWLEVRHGIGDASRIELNSRVVGVPPHAKGAVVSCRMLNKS